MAINLCLADAALVTRTAATTGWPSATSTAAPSCRQRRGQADRFGAHLTGLRKQHRRWPALLDKAARVTASQRRNSRASLPGPGCS